MVLKKSLFGLALFFAISAPLALGQETAKSQTALAKVCCQKEINMILGVMTSEEAYRANIKDVRVKIDASPEGEAEIAINYGVDGDCWQPRREDESSPCDYEISVSAKANQSLSEEELLAGLAHEFGHMTNRSDLGEDNGGRKLDDECYADNFSLVILSRLGIDRKTALNFLKKGLKEIPFASKEKIAEIQARIIHMEKTLAEEKKK